MLSRVADSIFWMARYIERADNLARLLHANQQLLLDAGASQGDETAFWQPILMTTGDEEGYRTLYPKFSGASVEEFLAVRPENNNSILNCIRTARENARMIRDQLSDEVWESINGLYLFLTSDQAAKLRQRELNSYYELVMRGSYLFQGIARATMMREDAWQFLQIGTYLERADKTSRLVDACSGLALVMAPQPGANPLRWAALLHSCSAFHGFREISHHLDPRRILEFLFLSSTFSRSVRFCVRAVDRALGKLKAPPGSGETPDPMRLVGRLQAELQFATIDEIIAEGVHPFIDRLQGRLNAIGMAIFQTFVLYADLVPVAAEETSEQTQEQ